MEQAIKVIKTKKLSSTVIAIDGEEYPREACKKIAGSFYKIGKRTEKDSGHGITIGETFYRIAPHTSASKIDWDYSKSRYELKTNMQKCIVGRGTLGYSSQVSDYFIVVNDERLPLLNEQLLTELNYRVDLRTNSAYWTYEDVNLDQLLRALQGTIGIPVSGIRKIRYENYPTDIYNMADYPASYIKGPSNIFEKSPFDKYLRNRTFGVEIETQAGHLPEAFLPIYGLVPLKDGSIAGHEYTSTVYDGNKPMVNLFDRMFTELAKYTIADQKTSLHYHIGNVPRTKEFVVSLWTLYTRVQDELEKMMPPYKRDIHYLATKQGGPKDHCQRLFALEKGDVDQMFEEILLFLAEGQSPKYANKENLIFQHPRADQPKWNWETRYMSLNFLPLLFEKKGTVEFRLHSGTVNKYKAVTWLFICNALIQYAADRIDYIINGKEKIMLYDVIDYVYNDDTSEGRFLTKYLIEYIIQRKKEHTQIHLTDRRGFGDEFMRDNRYTFKLNNKDLFNL